jgi:hypothetical protein
MMTFIDLLTLAACLALFSTTESALNRVTPTTRRCIRISLELIAGGSLLLAGAAVPGLLPTHVPGATALLSGFTLLLIANRRRRIRS